MRKILKFLLIIQETRKVPKLGIYKQIQRRLNPYNPLSYVTIIVVIIAGIVLFGFVGFWKETDLENPFKYH